MLAALGKVELDYTRDLESIWTDSREHVPQLNGATAHQLVEDFMRRTRPEALARPLGRAMIGTAGAGKTHMLGTLRQEIWTRGGWFVSLDLLDVNDFWATAALGFVSSLARPMQDGCSQGHALFDRLNARFGLSSTLKTRLIEPRQDAVWAVGQDFAAAVRREDSRGMLANRDVVYAFISLLSGDADQQDLARAWLTGTDIEQTGKAALRVLRSSTPARKAVEGLSWLMALGGPTLCAIDQIDAIVSVAHATAGSGAPSEDPVRNRAIAVIDELAGGLMELREVTQRSVTIVAALEATWETLRTRAIDTFRDRFEIVRLEHIRSPEAARCLVERRLAAAYSEAGFVPTYPSWPFRPEAFTGVTQFSPRQLLQACRTYIANCLVREAVEELVAFPNATGTTGEGSLEPSVGPPRPPPSPVPNITPAEPPDRVSAIDARYTVLCAAPPPPGLLDLGGDDARIAELLLAALRALVRQTELPPAEDLLVEHDTPGLHARLRHIDNEAGRERHHCFRALPHTNAIAAQNRLQAAITASGIDRELPFRHLIVLRRGAWPGGPRTAALVRQFEVRGGQVLAPDAQDFSRFAALKTLIAEAPPGLDAWLRARQPLTESGFFRSLSLVGVAITPAAVINSPAEDKVPFQADPPSGQAKVARRDPAGSELAIPLGIRPGDRQPVLLKLAMLPLHLSVIAGAGSGKTVFLRRLVEEAVLSGVPAILLDSNNDLVRLADPWPQRPTDFTDEDAAKASRFASEAEVVVWTPGRSRGNPLVLAPLPDFAAVGDDLDEREMAVSMAAATLEKLIPTSGQRGQLRAGVLTGALRHFARAGGGRLQDLVALLRDLPPEASAIDAAPRLGAEVANALVAAMERNPLLDGTGMALDPAVLLGGTPGRVRVSVVNLAGLPGDEARQDFVGRLLMALFGHVRRHPAGLERPAAGLLVMDEAQNFAPSDRSTPSRAATIALVRQARKYGLGMVFATQAPKAIDHNIIANCTTQLFGLTNSPAALDAVREMLRSRGGGGEDLGRLPRGQFYMTSEGFDRPQKLHAPLCLTYHPANPPSEDEVIERAAKCLKRLGG